MISRIFGFIRDILTAAILGAGPVADAFFVAFRLPNFFRQFFAEGAFSAAFVPMFSRILTKQSKQSALTFAEQSLSILACILLAMIGLVEIFMPQFMTVIAPGFMADPDKYELVITFSRITFPYLLFVSLVAIIGGVLNSLNYFAAWASAPILMNLTLIFALLVIVPYAPTAGHALSLGVFLAGVVQLLFMMGGLKVAGVSLKIRKPVINPEIKRLGRLVLPGAIGASVMQINLLVSTVIASFLPEGSVSYLYYADRIALLPTGVIGVAIGTALLPLLTRQIRSNQPVEANRSFNRSLEYALLMTLPAAAAMMIIPDTLISAMFERGAFDQAVAQATSAALVALSFGVPAFVIVKTFTPNFFAREDTKTPVKIAIFCVLANIALSIGLMIPFDHVGIAMANSLSSWMNAGLLFYVLHKHQFVTLTDDFKKAAINVIACTFLMSSALILSHQLLPLLSTHIMLTLVAQVGIGGVSYFAAAFYCKLVTPATLKTLTKKT